jgi:phage I-like protein
VHAGSHLLGFLPDEVADELRPQLAALAARRKSLEVEAVLHGDGPLTAAVEVFLPLTHG